MAEQDEPLNAIRHQQFHAELETRINDLAQWIREHAADIGHSHDVEKAVLDGLAKHGIIHGSQPPLVLHRKASQESRSSIERCKSMPSANDVVQREPVPHIIAPAGLQLKEAPPLPPGHFVSQVVSSPQPGRIKRSTSLHSEKREADESAGSDDGKHEHIRVSLEGVAQLGQLLCRMMLFPIFRSNNEYLHWKKIFRTVVRIKLPDDCRRKVWTIVTRRSIPPSTCKNQLEIVADKDIMDLCVQIEKDLHRTSDDEYFKTTSGRATLARVLLAYSQYNKAVGYCQSLNFIGANMLLLMNKNEEDAFAALAVIVDQLPQNYFSELEGLAVDMLVFDEYMKERLPRLHAHMRLLMREIEGLQGDFEEPPPCNVFIGQWFPTCYATLFPQSVLYRVWDSVLFDGDEMLFRVGLAIFTMLEPGLMASTDMIGFYTAMKEASENITGVINCDEMIKLAYNMYPFPLPRLSELRSIYSKKRAEIAKSHKKAASTQRLDSTAEEFGVFSLFGINKKNEADGIENQADSQRTKARTMPMMR